MKKIYLLLILLSFLPSFGGAVVVAQSVDKSICQDSTFTINSTEDATGSTYQWLENGTVIAGATAADYTIPATKTSGVYTYIRQSKSATCVDWQSSNVFTVQVHEGVCNPVGEVILAGVIWAGSNVGAVNTFASTAGEYTPFYQWNRTVAYAATGSSSSPSWTETSITDESWTVNPCPTGWRLPTKDEWVALDALGSYWATNTNPGRWYGKASGCTVSTCIFLPAVGFRDANDGSLNYQGSHGYAWSSTQTSSTYGYYLSFGSTNSYPSGNLNKALGFSLRCVK